MMAMLNVLTLLPVAFLLFFISLVVVMVTAAWFTRRLEALCEMIGLSIGILSLLSAIGANIPNYTASAFAIIGGHTDVGVGIIVGSSIFNIAIILGLCTLTSREAPGITLDAQEAQDAREIAWYALAIIATILVVIALLPATAAIAPTRQASAARFLLPLASVLVLGLFSMLIVHILRRSRPAPSSPLATHHHTELSRSPSVRALRFSAQALFSVEGPLYGP